MLWEYYTAVQEVVIKFFSKRCWFRYIKNTVDFGEFVLALLQYTGEQN